MDDEHVDPLVDVSRRNLKALNDEQWVRDNVRSLVSPNFIRHDRRRLTPQPPADAESWPATLVSIAEVAGRWPTYEFGEVVRVRGDRLIAYRAVMGLTDLANIEFVVVCRYDEAVERMELIYFFDPEDVDLALAELERLHAELGSDD